MLKGLDIEQLARQIKANADARKDIIASTNQLAMVNTIIGEDADGKPVNDLRMSVEGNGSYPLQPLMHNQVGEFTKIPAAYYDRMLTTFPDLLATNVNRWMRREDKKRMVRTLHGKARAFLSNRYQRIDNNEIAEVALPILYELPAVEIVSSQITERRLYIHFVVPGVAGEIKRGDVVQAGGVISNSEVGCGSCSIAALRWRLLCLNGMKGEEAYKRFHAGRAVEETGEMEWADDTRAADDRAILLKIRDMVRAVVDATRFNKWLEQARDLTEGKISGGNVQQSVEVLANKLGVNDTEKGSILTALIEGADLTRWGIVNAVTAQAHKAISYDRAVEFEAMGDRLINLPRKEWQEVLEAA